MSEEERPTERELLEGGHPRHLEVQLGEDSGEHLGENLGDRPTRRLLSPKETLAVASHSAAASHEQGDARDVSAMVTPGSPKVRRPVEALAALHLSAQMLTKTGRSA